MGIGKVQAWLGGVRDNLIVKLLKELNWFALLCVFMLTANAFAQPPAQDLQDSLPADSLHADSLSKISLDLEIDTGKVEPANVPVNKETASKKDYFPTGWAGEFAYAGPTTLHIAPLGFKDCVKERASLKKFGFIWGFPFVSADLDFGDDFTISDEGILSAVSFFFLLSGNETLTNVVGVIDYVLFGNTYFLLTDNGRFGLFEQHRVLDYAIYALGTGSSWEFGFSEAVGIRFVYTKTKRDDAYYVDLGAHVRITNKHFRFGVFLQWGFTGIHT
ncbi:MAG: hypothetical protein IK012_10300 [Fibrobacter sp.]|uniref:hypothetical protein n=1 Tax=Fibrobacter sp. TaxID=35828 RepID=UPI0025C6747F|nr:hypothetical protein [Fibrobacter sp.]MBR4785623.1 hypothetical protein [Fibrobacter sp.]